MNKKQIIIITIVILIIIVISGVFVRKFKKEKFFKYGIETTATITAINRKSEWYSLSKRNSYILEITFFTQVEKKTSNATQKIIEKEANGNYKINLENLKPHLGEFIKTSVKISGYQRSKYNVGDKIQILYIKNDPKEVMIKDL